MSETQPTNGDAVEPAVDVPPSARKAFVIASVVVAVVIAIALGYSVVRDPGPQPPVPPEITGTDDGALKRAIVHYVGAIASRDTDIVVKYTVASDGSADRARTTIDAFGDTAQQAATVTLTTPDSTKGSRSATVHWADGRTQDVTFVQLESGGWKAQLSPPPA